MQAMYQVQLNEQPLREIRAALERDGMLDDADEAFFTELLAEIDRSRDAFDELIGRFTDRPVNQIDPVERAVLYAALAEFTVRADIPYRVVISEAVTLARKFGGTDGHRYVNAILDRAARELRPQETGAGR